MVAAGKHTNPMDSFRGILYKPYKHLGLATILNPMLNQGVFQHSFRFRSEEQIQRMRREESGSRSNVAVSMLSISKSGASHRSSLGRFWGVTWVSAKELEHG